MSSTCSSFTDEDEELSVIQKKKLMQIGRESVVDRITFPHQNDASETAPAQKAQPEPAAEASKMSQRFNQANALIRGPSTCDSNNNQTKSPTESVAGTTSVFNEVRAFAASSDRPTSALSGFTENRAPSAMSTATNNSRYTSYRSRAPSFATASNFSTSMMSLNSIGSQATLVSGQQRPRMSRKQQLNTVKRFVEIVLEHQSSTNDDALRVQELCERYPRRYGEPMHKLKFKTVLGNPSDMAAAIRDFRPVVFDHLSVNGEDFVKLSDKADLSELLGRAWVARTPKPAVVQTQLDLSTFMDESILNDLEVLTETENLPPVVQPNAPTLPDPHQSRKMWQSRQGPVVSSKPRWEHLLNFGHDLHSAALKSSVSLTDYLGQLSYEGHMLDSYHVSVECAAFVLRAYLGPCFEITQKGLDFIINAIANMNPSSKRNELERIAVGGVNVADISNSIVLGKTYKVMVLPGSRCKENDLSLMPVGCLAYALANGDYNTKLRKLFEEHPNVHYALRRPQAGAYVLFQQRRCVVESVKHDLLQLHDLDTGERFTNVGLTAVFDPLFPDEYTSFPAQILRAKLILPDGRELTPLMVKELEALKYTICKASILSKNEQVFSVKLCALSAPDKWLPE